nr:E3 ubiquitin-protein ligase RNF181-like [Aegilops tauschii subsp. strangulata]
MASDAMDTAEDLPQEGDGLVDVAVDGQLFRRSTLALLALFGAALNAADITLDVTAADAPNDLDPAVVAAVAEALKTVDAPLSDEGLNCPICLEDDDTASWKETPCGHRFHGRCVEKWLQAKGGCPMCRCQVVAMPIVAATDAPYRHFVIIQEYGQDGTNFVVMDIDDDDDDDDNDEDEVEEEYDDDEMEDEG